jgi:SAM-dependent methyltransferase
MTAAPLPERISVAKPAASSQSNILLRLSHYTFKPSPYSSHLQVLNLFPPARGRVLDVGCGNGYLSAILSERGYEVTGVEQEGGYDERFPRNVRLITANLDDGLPPLEGEFDYIVCADILEHLKRPERLLKQLRSYLAPGGVLIGSLPNSGNFYFRLVILAGYFPQEDKGLFDRTHIRFYTYDGWRELFASAGFRFEREYLTAIPVNLRFPQWENSPLMRVAEQVCYGLARLWKRMFAYQFVVVARPL